MNPGQACIACHSTGEGPRFQVAGTVYSDFGQADNCGGVSAGLSVIITDAKGVEHSLPVNAMGNFYLESRTPLATPFTARVVDSNGGSRVMAAMQTVGDCNSCHTATGASGAPGRITAPGL